MKNSALLIPLISTIIVFLSCSDSKKDTGISQETNDITKLKIAENTGGQNQIEIVSTIEGQLPELWKITNTIVRPEDKMDFYSESFGGKVTRVENNFISVSEPNNFYKFQINVIKAQDEKEAAKIYDHLYSTSANKEKFILEGKIIYEVLAIEKFIEECRSILKK